jgi:hypothetical protein
LHGTVTIWATKTYRERTFSLSPRVVALLKQLYAEAKRHALAAGKPVRSLVFVNLAGQMIDQSRLTKRMKLVLGRAGLERAHGLYDLRHTFVTRAIAAGRSPTDIAAEIGDAVETVLRFYAHPTSIRRGAEVCNTSATREGKNLSHPPESNRRPADRDFPGKTAEGSPPSPPYRSGERKDTYCWSLAKPFVAWRALAKSSAHRRRRWLATYSARREALGIPETCTDPNRTAPVYRAQVAE